MTNDVVEATLGEHATKLENHNVRLGAVESFVLEFRGSFNKLLVGILLAGVAALIDLAVRR